VKWFFLVFYKIIPLSGRGGQSAEKPIYRLESPLFQGKKNSDKTAHRLAAWGKLAIVQKGLLASGQKINKRPLPSAKKGEDGAGQSWKRAARYLLVPNCKQMAKERRRKVETSRGDMLNKALSKRAA